MISSATEFHLLRLFTIEITMPSQEARKLSQYVNRSAIACVFLKKVNPSTSCLLAKKSTLSMLTRTLTVPAIFAEFHRAFFSLLAQK